MDLGLGNIEKLIAASGARHRAVLSNIANSDTPNYKAVDVSFSRIFDDESVGLSTTDPRHFGPVAAAASAAEAAEGTVPWGDGNNVELDREVAKMTENGILYQTALRLISRKMTTLRTAMRTR